MKQNQIERIAFKKEFDKKLITCYSLENTISNLKELGEYTDNLELELEQLEESLDWIKFQKYADEYLQEIAHKVMKNMNKKANLKLFNKYDKELLDIKFCDMDDEKCGYYSSNDKCIRLNVELLGNNSLNSKNSTKNKRWNKIIEEVLTHELTHYLVSRDMEDFRIFNTESDSSPYFMALNLFFNEEEENDYKSFKIFKKEIWEELKENNYTKLSSKIINKMSNILYEIEKHQFNDNTDCYVDIQLIYHNNPFEEPKTKIDFKVEDVIDGDCIHCYFVSIPYNTFDTNEIIEQIQKVIYENDLEFTKYKNGNKVG